MTLLLGHETGRSTTERQGIRRFGGRGPMGVTIFGLHVSAFQKAFTAQEASSNQMDRRTHPKDVSSLCPELP